MEIIIEQGIWKRPENRDAIRERIANDTQHPIYLSHLQAVWSSLDKSKNIDIGSLTIRIKQKVGDCPVCRKLSRIGAICGAVANNHSGAFNLRKNFSD